jgi:phosphoglycolate phosphatase-like HAD superfamily hydrolase
MNVDDLDALTSGVRVIGVVTGKTSAEELREAGATWVVNEVAAIPNTFSRVA